MTLKKLYDENDMKSILQYAKKLEGMTLREVLPEGTIARMSIGNSGNKGRFGHKIEKYYFEYDINSDVKADFPCGLELKATPLKVLKNGTLSPKERLVCNIINYENIIAESWEMSSFLDKNSDILMIRYIDPMDKSIDQLDYKIVDVRIHNIFDNKDIARQFEEDWNFIVDKVKRGEAHLLSESDTKYLGACTKGATAASSLRSQPNCSIPAQQRAFSFKTKYMRHLLNKLNNS